MNVITGDDDDNDSDANDTTNDNGNSQENPNNHSVGSIILGGGNNNTSDDDDNDDDSALPPMINTTTYTATTSGGFYCGTTMADSQNNCHRPCSTNADCHSNEVCWGSWNSCYDSVRDDSDDHEKKSPLPKELQPRSDFRCGVSEVDARSNCGVTCSSHDDCNGVEFCWPTHSNYCHMMPEEHPYCEPSQAEQVHRRCGYDEQAARSFCGIPCHHSSDCSGEGEYCFPVQLNLCKCFQQQDDGDNDGTRRQLASLRKQAQQRRLFVSNRKYFDAAKEPLMKYFVVPQDDPTAVEDESDNSNMISSSSKKTVTIPAASSSAESFRRNNNCGAILLVLGLFSASLVF